MSSARSQSLENSPAYIYLQGNPQPIPLHQKFQFGRTENFDNPAVSRTHFTIAANGSGAYFILDHNTRTGTRVDGNSVPTNTWVELREGSAITVGPYTFNFTFLPPQGVKVKAKLEVAPSRIAPLPTPTGDRRRQARAGDKPSQSGGARPTPEIALNHDRPPVAKPILRPRPLADRTPLADDAHKNDKTFLAAMASINIIVFGIQLMVGGGLTENSRAFMINMGANSGHLSTGGQWWRLFTSAFLHWDVWHLIGNVGALYFAAAYIVRYLTPNKIMAVYLGSAFVASIMSALMFHPATVSAGASGAVFGLYGAILVSVIMYRNRGIKLNAGLLATAAHFAIMNLGVGQAGVDYWAHLGGLFAGAVITYLCLELLPENDSGDTGKLIGVCSLLVAFAIMVLPQRKLSSEDQMAPYFSMYMEIMNEYYAHFKAVDQDRDQGKFERNRAATIAVLVEYEKELKKVVPVDQRANYYKKHIAYLTAKTMSHSRMMSKYIKTGARNYLSYAKQDDAVMGQEIALLSKAFIPNFKDATDGPAKTKPAPAARPRERRAVEPRDPASRRERRAPGSRAPH